VAVANHQEVEMPTLRLVPASGAPAVEVAKESSLVGRETGCDVVVADGSVSRRHARIERRGEDFFVIDQASANGTFLDSQKVGEAVLKHGQDLRLGAVHFRVEITGQSKGDEIDATVVHAVLTPPPVAPAAPAPPAPPTPPAQAAVAPPPPKTEVPPVAPKPTPAPPPPPPPPPPPATPRKEPLRPTRPDGGAAAPAPKKRGPAFWLTSGCCGCLTLLLLLALGVIGVVGYATRDAAAVVRTQLGLLKAGDLDGAYQAMSTSYRGGYSREEFEQIVAAHPSLRDNAESSFLNRSRSNGIVTLSGSLTASTGETEKVVYQLVFEDGGWKIASLRFEGDDIRVPDLQTE
jgi:hypothetical protein